MRRWAARRPGRGPGPVVSGAECGLRVTSPRPGLGVGLGVCAWQTPLGGWTPVAPGLLLGLLGRPPAFGTCAVLWEAQL